MNNTPKEYISGSSLTIIDDEAKHVARVLRKQPGTEIYVTDGEGNASIKSNTDSCIYTYN